MRTKSISIKRINGNHHISTIIHIIKLPQEFEGQLNDGIKIEYQVRFQVIEHLDSKKLIEQQDDKDFAVAKKNLQLDIYKIITDDKKKVPTHDEYKIQTVKNVPLDETLSLTEFLDNIDHAVRPFVYVDFLQNLDSNRRKRVNTYNATLVRMKALLRRTD